MESQKKLVNYSISCGHCKKPVRFNFKKDLEVYTIWQEKHELYCRNCKKTTYFEGSLRKK